MRRKACKTHVKSTKSGDPNPSKINEKRHRNSTLFAGRPKLGKKPLKVRKRRPVPTIGMHPRPQDATLAPDPSARLYIEI